VVAEFSQAPIPGYIWGEPVRYVFDALDAGYSLQTCLHATSVVEGIEAVTMGNGISDEAASSLKLVLYIERFGDNPANFWRRLVEIFEVERVKDGRPVGQTLFRWQARNDSFEQTAAPKQFGSDLEQRAGLIAGLALQGRTSAADVGDAVAAFRRGREVHPTP
jgi:hypothetical protein